jgi:hypothetical protein
VSPYWFLLAAWLPQQPAPTVDEILAKIQTNTGQFLQSLPDFICDETITSQAIVGGKLEQVVNSSHFVGRQQKRGNMLFNETRELISIDGKSVSKNANPQGPIFFGGGFSSVLHLTFGKDTVPDQTYRITGEERFRDREAIVIEFATRQGQKNLKFDFYGKAYLENDKGKAWIDKESLRVLRLERQYLNVPKGETPITATVDYGEVFIDGQPYWMPLTVKAEQLKGRRGQNAEYLAEYRNYRKFEAKSSIIY